MTERETDFFLQRLTLECGHLSLYGPWDSSTDLDGRPRRMIGDITFCEICPRVPAYPGARHQKEMALRVVVNVEDVPAGRYREAQSPQERKRLDQLSEMTS